MTTVSELLAAALADRYRIEREIGEGGMATVYLAEDLKHRRKVALKVLRPELAATLGAERFLREIEVAANLQHPHILPLFDSGEAGGFLFYVMPYIEGESLRGRLARGGELPVAEAAKILRDVVDALAHAHQHGVVHRDIKPDNVLLSGRHALVTDFGVAKAVSEATGRQSLTTVGVALGTPMYMAPEQAVADPHVDFRADLYAVGVMAYEMLTGSPPFTGPSAQAILAAHVTEPAKPITAVRQSVPPALAQMIMQCLEKRPADRPASAEVLVPQLEALSTLSGGMTPTATAPSTAVRAPGPKRRIPRWALAAVGVAVVAGGGYGVWRLVASRAGGAVAQSVAVLPFENVGGDTANRTFTDGVQDEILTDLTRVGALQVTSRTSIQEYRDSKKSVKQIGAELGVATLLEGQVQRAGNEIHVNVQLVDAAHDRQLWANSYDRELTAETIFAMQGDIAQNVAQALQASLTPAQAAAVDKAPTTNLEALDWYHRGKELFGFRSGTLDTLASAAFAKAVALDSSFAEAWAGLAAARSWQVRVGSTIDTVPARTALDRAMVLAPSSPETRLAQAYFAYYAKADFGDALAHFNAVAAARPGDVNAIQGIGYIMRRQGQWANALDAERRVVTLDPRDAGALDDLGESYIAIRRFDDAVFVLRQALILSPTKPGLIEDLAICLLAGKGDTAGARVAISGFSSTESATSLASLGSSRWTLNRWARHFKAANAALDSAPTSRQLDRAGILVERGLDDRAAGDARMARVHADSAARIARAALGQSGTADVFGNLANVYTILGFAEAMQGKSAEAIADAQRAVALNPRARDALESGRSEEGLIYVYILSGEGDAAIRLIQAQASRPVVLANGIMILTREVIRMDPLFDSIRNDPRMQALLANDAAWVVK